MKITEPALKRIKQLLARQRLPDGTGLRLGFEQARVFLKWDPSGPRPSDLVVKKRGVPIFIDAQAYVRLADYELDLAGGGGAPAFKLRHKQPARADFPERRQRRATSRGAPTASVPAARRGRPGGGPAALIGLRQIQRGGTV